MRSLQVTGDLVKERVIALTLGRAVAADLQRGAVVCLAEGTLAPAPIGHPQADGQPVRILIEKLADLLRDDLHNVGITDTGPWRGGTGNDQSFSSPFGEILRMRLAVFLHRNEPVDIVRKRVTAIHAPWNIRLRSQSVVGVQRAESSRPECWNLNARFYGYKNRLMSGDDCSKLAG